MTVRVLHNDGILDDMREQWQKLCGLILHKLGHKQIKVTPEDVEAFANGFNGDMPCVFLDGRGGKEITVYVMSQTEAEKFLREIKSN